MNQAIVGGTTDTGDPAVVLMVARRPGSQSLSLCTGEVISPHVVMTAAHCVHPAEVGADAVFNIYPGPDIAQMTPANSIAVKETHANPTWSPTNLEAGHDVGVLILMTPAGPPTLAFQRDALTPALKGQPVRFVGYGVTSPGAGGSSGRKRQTNAMLTDFDATKLFVADPLHNTCSGDSGGPMLMTINGIETIVGITSFGDQACAQGGYSTRVDAEHAFVEQYVAANDPAGTQGPMTGPEPDAGMSTDAGDPASGVSEAGGDLSGTHSFRPAEDAGIPGCAFAAPRRTGGSSICVELSLLVIALFRRRLAAALVCVALVATASGCLSDATPDSGVQPSTDGATSASGDASDAPGDASVVPGHDASTPTGPVAGEPAELAGITNAHNAVRAGVGVPPMTWNPALAQLAAMFVDDCVFAHSSQQERSNKAGFMYIGENLYMSGGFAPTGQKVSDAWAGEAADYDYATNGCSAVCGHYTQQVWKTSTQLGCAVKACPGNQYVVACEYGPGGNYSGQRPY